MLLLLLLLIFIWCMMRNACTLIKLLKMRYINSRSVSLVITVINFYLGSLAIKRRSLFLITEFTKVIKKRFVLHNILLRKQIAQVYIILSWKYPKMFSVSFWSVSNTKNVNNLFNKYQWLKNEKFYSKVNLHTFLPFKICYNILFYTKILISFKLDLYLSSIHYGCWNNKKLNIISKICKAK